jgi:hypothetical protein
VLDVQVGAELCRVVHCVQRLASCAGWCTTIQVDAQQCMMLENGAVWCKMVQCGAEWCSVVQNSAVCCRMVQCGSVVQNSPEWCRVVQGGLGWCRAITVVRNEEYHGLVKAVNKITNGRQKEPKEPIGFQFSGLQTL